jgi:hypothetical protein
MKQLQQVRRLKHGEELEQVKGPGSKGHQARAGPLRNGQISAGAEHAGGGGRYREGEAFHLPTSPFAGTDGLQESQHLAASPLSALKSETVSRYCNSIIHREPQPHRLTAPGLMDITEDSIAAVP